ncbi:alpha-ketoglutarate dependent xanthine dioxygenase-2 [Coleophoma crateriformis]|uniref:Alpha-ketoglutarate dependent xanthine dioxygenase-2 n=1 Tax=Coleophoma crateriformis TaxID=565419 RepID=A0A3D8SZ88_9HELO|nr:alpha-ketoglutarate dependent xanthine dioxygenase-2 [Coleophoma crateriformis]
MPHKLAALRVEPLGTHIRKSSQIGAEVILPDSMKIFNPQALTEDDTQLLRQALFDHGVLVIRNQLGVAPGVLSDIAKLFDSQAQNVHSGGKTQVTDPKNILSQNNCSRIQRAPQVTIIGQGRIEEYEGIPLLELKHLDQSSFHERPLSDDEIEKGYTRPYRWHMDAPLYESLPGFVTSIHAIEVPQVPDQQLQFPGGQSMPIAAGATIFFSGARNFELLSPEEQEFACNTTVQYAPRAYEWIRDCKASADGLTIQSKGREKKLDELAEWTWEKVQSFPMVWENHGNGKPHLQILGCCVYSLTTTDPATGKSTVIDDIHEVRRVCYALQSKVYAPENIFAHRWEQGDLVMFHNRGLLHSISGQLSRYPNRRLLWQCSMASGALPKAYKNNKA